MLAANASVKWTIGIDVGTQSMKAVLVDSNMKAVAVASESYEVTYPRAGWAEQNPHLWEAALPKVIAEVLRKAGVAKESVAAIGLAGQLDGCIAVDHGGSALTNCLIWMDRRATVEADSVDAKIIHSLNGITADAGHMAAKIVWLKKNAGLKSAEVRCFHQPVSYLVSRLTGEHVMDHSLASTTMLYSLEKRDYDSELLAAFGIVREELPRIDVASASAGVLNEKGAELTGLPRGVNVAVGTGDDFSGPLGAGITKPGRMICILGTAEVVGALDVSAKVDPRGLVETHPYIGKTFYIENPGWLSGGALTWFQETFGVRRVEEIDEMASKVPPGSEGLLFLPALSGAMAPEWNASARGGFYGLTPAHGLGHMARAVLEGCAFAMNDVIVRLREMNVPIESVLLTGGGAKSVLWGRIRADVSGFPTLISEFKDTSPVGAAVLAAVSSGLQADVQSAARLVEQISTSLSPNPRNAAVYAAMYSRYRLLFESLKPLFKHDRERAV